jgi:hypothetical protein
MQLFATPEILREGSKKTIAKKPAQSRADAALG